MTGRRVVIVGGGVAGLATAWWLARRRAADVVLLEREEELGTGSTGRSAGILRTASRDATSRLLGDETAQLLRAPPAGFTESALVDLCGLVLVDDPERGEPAWLAPLAGKGAVERIDLERLARIAPHFRPGGARAWLFPEEGRIDVGAVVNGLARGARAAGAVLRTGARVADFQLAGRAVRGVRLHGGERVDADWTVLAAGGWAARLGARAGSRLELRPTRRHLVCSAADARVDPSWPIVWDESTGFYARPCEGGLLLCACDEEDVDPDGCEVDGGVLSRIERLRSYHLPELSDAAVTEAWAGMRTFAPDDVSVAGPDPDVEGLFWVAGLGGHGMSTGWALGRVAATLLAGGTDELAPALSPRRALGARDL